MTRTTANHSINVEIAAEENGLDIRVTLVDRGSTKDNYDTRQVVQRYLSSRSITDPGTFVSGLVGTVIEGVTAALDLSTDTLFDGMVRPTHDDWGVKVVQDGGMAGAKIARDDPPDQRKPPVTPLEPRDFDPDPPDRNER